jgi:hypothetical protein
MSMTYPRPAYASKSRGLLAVPATVGELWIMGYLIIVGVHSRRGEEVS